jgi:hypothetical protein
MPKKKVKDPEDEKLRSPAMADALREVEAADEAINQEFHHEIARKGHSTDLESRQKTKVRQEQHEIEKVAPMAQRLRTEMAIGGVRGKFHQSKKGLGKTVSNRSRKQMDRE